MGFFSNLFGKGKNEEQQQNEKQDDQQPIFYAKPDQSMKEATLNAQQNFNYFWRELYWEHRRIIPAHDFAMIKVPFEQENQENEPTVEHMWVNNINFDGEYIYGELVNEPNELTNIAKGAAVKKRRNEISDWMFSIGGRTHGGFTIQAMRSNMSEPERQEHDKAWGLDFGDFNDILVVYKQKEEPENLIDHPMSRNMVEKMKEFIAQNPTEITHKDEQGMTLLHREAIAGNKKIIEVLLETGADKTLKSTHQKTAYDYAKDMQWNHVLDILK